MGFVKGHAKIGGRKKSTPNRKTIVKMAERGAIKALELKRLATMEPLDHVLAVMRDPREPPSRRDMMANAAAP